MAPPPTLPRTPYSGIVYRIVRGGRDPLSTEASRRHGGRYNPRREFGALYGSLDAATAIAEVARRLERQGTDPKRFPRGHYWGYEMQVTVEALLDLTNTDVLQQLNIDSGSLLGDDITITQQIALRAKREGYQGLIVPSAATRGGQNLVLFPDTLSTPLRILSSRPVQF